ncbi:hypothetical protein EV286_107331 [Rhizobium sp. BK251]|nr:hypothetical protein EV286_107331 [Rhizobium sp. BK251]
MPRFDTVTRGTRGMTQERRGLAKRRGCEVIADKIGLLAVRDTEHWMEIMRVVAMLSGTYQPEATRSVLTMRER